MRKDMHKVLVEEPRHGGNRSKKGRRGNVPDELLPKFEGIKRPHTNRKWFGEHLGPLKRWLRSNVGRPWNDVYSEAAQVMRGGNPVRTHIRSHMMDMIKRHTFMRDGEVWCLRHGREVAIKSLGSYFVWPTFYVHPINGQLLALPDKPRKRRTYRIFAGTAMPTDPTKRDVIPINDFTLLRRLRGLWFECSLERFPDHFLKGEIPWRYDFAERRMICRARALEIYRDYLFCVRKRQISSKESKRLGLRNDSFPTGSAECPSLGAHSAESTKILGQASSLPAITGMVLRIGGLECD